MAIRDKNYLKDKFRTGDNPLEEDFSDLIDSFMHVQEFVADDIAYDSTSWNGNTAAPTKNVVRDKIVQIDGEINNKLNLSGGTLTGALTLNGDPSSSLHAVTKQYVDNLITGISWKNPCKVATTANITLSGTQTIDGVSLIAGDRVLVKNQSTQSQNGIYAVATGTWSRTEDANSNSELETATVHIEQGTTNQNTQWTCTTTNVSIGVTNITFGQISGKGTYTASTGVSLVGSDFRLDATYLADGSKAGLLSTSDWAKLNNALLNGGNAFGSSVLLGTTDNNPIQILTNNSNRITIDTSGITSFGSSFAASSGSSAYTIINIVPTYNQTGTANGTIRGIYYNPTAISVQGSHYAFESTSGDMYVGGSGKFLMSKSSVASSALEVSGATLKVGSDFSVTEVNNPVFKSVTQNISGSVSIDLSQGRIFYLTLTGNVTSFSFTNEVVNAQYTFYFIKGTTEYAFTWATNKFRFPFKTPFILTNPTTNGSSPASSTDIMTAICSASGRLDIVRTPDLQLY